MNEDVEDEVTKSKRPRIWQPQRETVQTSHNWKNLPYPAAVKVLRYLCDEDRGAMSQVCRNWHSCFKDPSLWRARRMILNGWIGEYNICFTSLFGSFLHDVVLVCLLSPSIACSVFTENLQALLQNIKSARLRNFKLKFLQVGELENVLEHEDTFTRCLIDMFRIQTDLKKIKFDGCHLSLSSGTDVLESLASSTGRQLRELILEEYFQTSLHVYGHDRFQDTVRKFENLTNIGVNYSYISDEIIRHWAVNLRHTLEWMEITVTDREPHDHIITKGAWREISASCTKLKVSIKTIGLCHAHQTIPLLQDTIPLNSFGMDADMESNQNSQLLVTLKCLTSYFHHRLEKVSFDLQDTRDPVDTEMVYLLGRCRKLESFCVSGNIGQKVANAISNRLADSQSLLCTVKLVWRDDIDPQTEKTFKLQEAILYPGP
ncbi:hypothetical protein Btru_028236 [Bulinus truncatus]|nr:hypothetical protein Btru_028236 [Bulinus truncatus]